MLTSVMSWNLVLLCISEKPKWIELLTLAEHLHQITLYLLHDQCQSHDA